MFPQGSKNKNRDQRYHQQNTVTHTAAAKHMVSNLSTQSLALSIVGAKSLACSSRAVPSIALSIVGALSLACSSRVVPWEAAAT